MHGREVLDIYITDEPCVTLCVYICMFIASMHIYAISTADFVRASRVLKSMGEAEKTYALQKK